MLRRHGTPRPGERLADAAVVDQRELRADDVIEVDDEAIIPQRDTAVLDA